MRDKWTSLFNLHSRKSWIFLDISLQGALAHVIRWRKFTWPSPYHGKTAHLQCVSVFRSWRGLPKLCKIEHFIKPERGKFSLMLLQTCLWHQNQWVPSRKLVRTHQRSVLITKVVSRYTAIRVVAIVCCSAALYHAKAVSSYTLKFRENALPQNIVHPPLGVKSSIY